MGKVKQLMHSARTKLSPSKSVTSKCSSQSSTAASSYSRAQKSLKDISMAQTKFIHPRTEGLTLKSADCVPVEETGCDRQTLFDAHAALQTNVAILDFAKKLPLEELRMIGYQPTVPPSAKRSDTSDTSDDFSHFLAMSKKQMTHSKTSSLTSKDSDSTWSFACRSAHRIERDDDAALDCDDDTLSFGSLVGWGIDHVGLNTNDSSMPDTSDTRILYGDAQEASENCTGHSQRPSSITRQSFDSCDLFLESIGLPVHETSFPRMSDEQFEALPDWTDVENDTEYNEFEGRPFHWSRTNSLCSSRASMEADLVFPMDDIRPWDCHNGH